MGNVKQRAIWGLKDSCWTPLPVVPVETDGWETKPTTVKTRKTIPEEEKQQLYLFQLILHLCHWLAGCEVEGRGLVSVSVSVCRHLSLLSTSLPEWLHAYKEVCPDVHTGVHTDVHTGVHTDVHTGVDTGEGVGVKRQIGVELQRKGGFADPA